MNILKRSWLSVTICTLAIFSSCQRNTDVLIPNPANTGNVVSSSPVNASVQGKVIDQNNNPVAGATVKAAGNVTTTDSRGLFYFNRINIDRYASVVTVEANGYFKGIRTFSAKDGSSDFVKLKLLTKNLIASVDAATGGTVTLPDNSQVIFSASSVVVKSTGAAYTGPVRVYAAKIDPTATDIAETIPGSLQAVDSSNYRVILKSFGMLAVQLEGSTGEQLQIATGKTAKLHVTIPVSLLASAPASLPLWYMDETTGLWMQQGSATKTGDAYEGNVAHFSYWFFGPGSNGVFFDFTLTTANGPIPDAPVRVTSANLGNIGWGFTDSQGYLYGFVPVNELLQLEISDYCYEPIYTQNIGPYTQNTSIGLITLSAFNPHILEISGSAVDCSNQPVNNATALIYYAGFAYHIPVVNGQFSANLLNCTNSTEPIEVAVVDNINNQQSSTWTANATTGPLNAGTLTVCGSSTDQYVNYLFDGVNYSISTANPGDHLQSSVFQSTTYFSANSGSNAHNIGMNWNGNTIGTFDVLIYGINQFPSNITTINPSTINVTTYGIFGQFIEGNFDGTVMDSTSTTHAVSGTFKVRHS